MNAPSLVNYIRNAFNNFDNGSFYDDLDDIRDMKARLVNIKRYVGELELALCEAEEEAEDYPEGLPL